MVTETKEAVVCIHNSESRTTPDGDISICKICRQKVLSGARCDSSGKIVFIKETVLERGYINGVITEVHPPLKNEEVVMVETPVELTREQKAAIAQDAANRGIKVVATELNLDWKVIRAWVLTYCKKTAKKAVTAREAKCGTCVHGYDIEAHRWCSIKKCPSRVPLAKRVTYRETYRPLPHPKGTKVLKSPDEQHVIVHVYQLADGFPKFSECHSPEAEVEWLRIYRDLALYAPKEVKTQNG